MKRGAVACCSAVLASSAATGRTRNFDLGEVIGYGDIARSTLYCMYSTVVQYVRVASTEVRIDLVTSFQKNDAPTVPLGTIQYMSWYSTVATVPILYLTLCRKDLDTRNTSTF
jgi:hypothetical protein